LFSFSFLFFCLQSLSRAWLGNFFGLFFIWLHCLIHGVFSQFCFGVSIWD
jgi:hypothetical protein